MSPRAPRPKALVLLRPWASREALILRYVFFAAVLSILFVSVPASACGGSGDGDGSRYCHDYTIHVGDDSTGLHANERGQFLLALDTPLGGQYVEQDVAYADAEHPWMISPENDDWLFSLWHYQEANGHPGLQRADEVCNNTPEGWDSDVIIC